MQTISELIQWIDGKARICVIPHVSPDGDAIGSALALSLVLKRLGKQACVASVDALPQMYAFLPGQEDIFSPNALPFQPDGLLFDDVAAFDRAGDKGILSGAIAQWALLDHHETNQGFAEVSVVDGHASATGILVMRLIDQLGLALDEQLAVYLYTAIATDTGNFSFSNTTPEALRQCARLLETGFDLNTLNRRLFRLRAMPRAKLLGKALGEMQFYLDGRVAVARITQAMFDACGAEQAHTEGIVNYLCDIEGVVVGMTVEARDEGRSTKFSLRSEGEIDVSKVAHAFGGGGHKNAAGMNLPMPVEEAYDVALDAVLKVARA
ncbi:MAG: bifunctional oligoribonuclease/PAP phosphatase NrnA [Clostridia bacterium]